MSVKPAQHHQDTSNDAVPSDPLRRHSGVQARVSAPPASLPEAGQPLISIGSRADVALLEPTYAYLSTYTFAMLPPRVAERLNVAIYELYANALRYGSAAGEVRLELFRTSGGARVSVSNYASDSDRLRLVAQADRVQRDAEAVFRAEMARFDEGSAAAPMLGLVRVAHESKLPLSVVIEGELVRVASSCEA